MGMKDKLMKNPVMKDISLNLLEVLQGINDNQMKLEKIMLTIQDNQEILADAVTKLEKKVK